RPRRPRAGAGGVTMRAAIAVAALALAACATNDTVEPPAELQRFDASLPVQRAWTARVGGDAEARTALAPAIAGNSVYVAGNDGVVMALGLEDGARAWRVETRTRRSGGPGAGRDLVVVGGADGVVIALEAATGAERWRRTVSS